MVLAAVAAPELIREQPVPVAMAAYMAAGALVVVPLAIVEPQARAAVVGKVP